MGGLTGDFHAAGHSAFRKIRGFCEGIGQRSIVEKHDNAFSCFWRVPSSKILLQASLHRILDLLTLVSCHFVKVLQFEKS